ncbi:hypothetical protein QTN47_06575 [Danxiaibacter flavus]|uniref:Uncharacterized protein n=1 Tax=Danxiaibacter flavus TaxID=3049108 RepID=A0ABV3ZDL6_9BACT|nr:hypothetical protein QNM32_06575 [Chitinophagaceae bacterium DXS]
MKKLLTATVSILVIALACTKNVHTPTPEPEPPINIREVLTKQAWQLKELRALQGNKMYYYLRGGSNNNMNFDKEYVFFKDDNTGTYFDGVNTYNIPSWSFKDSIKSILVYNIDYRGQVLPVTWEHLKVTKDSLNYDEFYTRGGQISLAVGARTPVACGKSFP